MSSTGSSRGNPAMGDIVRSMVVIALIILALYGVGKLFTTDAGDPVETVDYAKVVELARPAADFPLLAPEALPQGWRATSTRFAPEAWHLGVLTDDEEYIGLEQVRTSAKKAVERFADGSRTSGTVDIDGTTWDVRRDDDGGTTLVRSEDGLTTLVTGTAPRAVVESYVSSLSAS